MMAKGYAVLATVNSDDRFVARCAMRVRGRLEQVYILEGGERIGLKQAEKILSEYMGVGVKRIRVEEGRFWRLVWELRRLITDLVETGYRVKLCMSSGDLLALMLLVSVFILPREISGEDIVIEVGNVDYCVRFSLSQLRALSQLNLQQQTVLDVLWSIDEPASLTSLAKETSVPKSTLHRVLVSLQRVGIVDRLGDKYMLSAALREGLC